MGWAHEMVQQKKVEFLRLSFLIAGHTKFSPDLLFSKIAQSYNRSDVFTTEELKNIISLYAEVLIDEGGLVCDWRTPIGRKFSKLPGIRSLHDFVYANGRSGVVATVRKLCNTGSYQPSACHVLRGRVVSECIIPDPRTHSYSTLRSTRPLTDSKLQHLKQMYRDFIPSNRQMQFD